ncbi:MAG TPA: hypothetical protein VEP28_09880, partial [Rubrobacter sp.]|nr:hypothetical protein [Rubrobacter sp.]
MGVHVQDEAGFTGPYQACYLCVQPIYSKRVHAHAKNVDPASTRRAYMWRHKVSSSSEKRASHEFLRASSMRARL